MSYNSAAGQFPVHNLASAFAKAAGEHVPDPTVCELEQLLFRLEQQLLKSIADRFGQIRETAAAHNDRTKSAEELELYRRLLFKAFERVNDNERRVANAKLQLLIMRSKLLDARLASVFQAAAAKNTCQATRKTTRKTTHKNTLRRNIYCALPDGTNELVLTVKVPRNTKRKSANMSDNTERKSANMSDNTERNTKRGCM